MIFNVKRYWWIGLIGLLVLPILLLKLLSLTGKRPDRSGSPETLPMCPDSPNCVCSEETRESHSIAPLGFTGDAAAAWARLRAVLVDLGGEEVRAGDRYLWFEFRTSLVQFTDDVECRLNAELGQIEIRSASRVGRSDLGANRKRVEAIRTKFDAAGGEQSE